MLPERIAGLERLSRNLWWTWDAEACSLFEGVDAGRWHATHHNPVAMLQELESERAAELAQDEVFCGRLDKTLARLDAYLTAEGWCKSGSPEVYEAGVAYFSMEFGLTESLRIYSGGLGVLAGDHLKSASDLGVPLVAIGLMYRRGYFRQVIDDGQQLVAYPEADFTRLPVRLLSKPDGEPLLIHVPMGNHDIQVQVWRADVGRVPLLLLDTHVHTNSHADRSLSASLYGGDTDTRIRQEVLLAIGGVRALRALGIKTRVYHMNEGHCAFVPLELMRERFEEGDSFSAALAWVRNRAAFTTHTPVPAGHDRFGFDLVESVLGPYRRVQELPQGAHMDLGRVRPGDWNETLCMTVLALRTAGKANGVSALHGEVSRQMWRDMWPDRAVKDVPIGHITNGVHPFYWMAPEMRALLDKKLPAWRDAPWDLDAWKALEDLPDELLWDARKRVKRRMTNILARRAGIRLDPQMLTLGFARRFAPYKRGDMLFRDPDRLARLLESGPFQLLYAGKAHPADVEGRKIIATVLKWAASSRFRDRVHFVEEYDLEIGQALTSGSDVWLNNPRRPHEASGTSGQKVLLNGGINLSILDGWWAEGWDGTNGWAIGAEHVNNPPEGGEPALDAADAESLYRMIEHEVIPTWRDRGEDGVPHAWVRRMKRSMSTGIPRFNTHRMVRDYVLEMYAPLVQAQQAE